MWLPLSSEESASGTVSPSFLPHLTLSASGTHLCAVGLACGQRGNEPESADVLPPEKSLTSFTDNLGAFSFSCKWQHLPPRVRPILWQGTCTI